MNREKKGQQPYLSKAHTRLFLTPLPALPPPVSISSPFFSSNFKLFKFVIWLLVIIIILLLSLSLWKTPMIITGRSWSRGLHYFVWNFKSRWQVCWGWLRLRLRLQSPRRPASSPINPHDFCFVPLSRSQMRILHFRTDWKNYSSHSFLSVTMEDCDDYTHDPQRGKQLIHHK